MTECTPVCDLMEASRRDWFKVSQGLSVRGAFRPAPIQHLLPLLLLTQQGEKLTRDPDVVAYLVSVGKAATTVGEGTMARDGPRETTPWSMSQLDNDGVVSRCSTGLAKMMAAVQACDDFDLTVSEQKTKTVIFQPPGTARKSLSIEVAGQGHAQRKRLARLHGQLGQTSTCLQK